MRSRLQFKECDGCHGKAGSEPLCAGCQHNRRLIAALRQSMMDELGETFRLFDALGIDKECLDNLPEGVSSMDLVLSRFTELVTENKRLRQLTGGQL